MVQLNLALREINCKVVYFGCGLGGKTTNLEIVHEKAMPDSRGELTSIATESDRTLFFDFMPLDLGTVSGMRVKFQLYTVPGQVYYNSTRKLVLRGADGVIFVADSQADKIEENLESLENLAECLREQGRDLSEMPHVIQFNKRDLPGICSVEELKERLNKYDAPCFEAVASKGDGVLETFKALAAMMLDKVKAMSTESAAKPGGRTQRMGGEPRTGAQRVATDAHRLQGGIASTPVEPTPIARDAARPAARASNDAAARRFGEPSPRSFGEPSPRSFGEPAPRSSPANESSARTPPKNEPAAREFAPAPNQATAGRNEVSESATPPQPPQASARESMPAAEQAVEQADPSSATATQDRVRPSVRRRADAPLRDAAPPPRRGHKTTAGVRVAGGGIMITTSARRRNGSSNVVLILAIVTILGAGAAAAWHFLM